MVVVVVVVLIVVVVGIIVVVVVVVILVVIIVIVTMVIFSFSGLAWRGAVGGRRVSSAVVSKEPKGKRRAAKANRNGASTVNDKYNQTARVCVVDSRKFVGEIANSTTVR